MVNTQKSNSGVMMILSPAKTLDLTPFVAPSSDAFPQLSTPDCDVAKSNMVASEMKKQSKKDLEKLLSISSNLATMSHGYWSNFGTSKAINKPAIYAFSGAAYQGLDIATCSVAAVNYLQNNLRIIDPLYGILRPLDMIQPYRLEMSTKKVLTTKQMEGGNLSSWWSSSVTSSLSQDLQNREDKILINVASDEYSCVVDSTSLPDGSRYIKIVFQQEGRVIAVHAKKARGMMVRYLAENNVRNVEEIRRFAAEGYKIVEGKSTTDTIVFDRPKPVSNAPVKKKKQATIAKETGASQKKRRTQSK